MGITLTITRWNYNPTSGYLKLSYNNGCTEIYHPVPKFIYANLLRRTDKAAFVQKYLEYDVHFHRMSIQ